MFVWLYCVILYYNIYIILCNIVLYCIVVVVATSNRPPDALYENGLNRDIIFEPFVRELKRFCVLHDVTGDVDYRMVNSSVNGKPNGARFT